MLIINIYMYAKYIIYLPDMLLYQEKITKENFDTSIFATPCYVNSYTMCKNLKDLFM